MGDVVNIPFDTLRSDKDLSQEIFKAYGQEGLGILTVSDIPGFLELKKELLPLSHRMAHLPEEVKASLEDEHSMYNAGWSHGKEKLGDSPDLAKGSFYDEERTKYPFFFPKNIWPSKDLPELEERFKALGKVMFEISVLLARHIDTVIQAKIPSYSGDLHAAMGKTQKIKGRMLYYYPCDKTDAEDAWIGWHNDSGFLTVLAGSMFFDDSTGEIIENPDPKGGLWIVDRKGGSVRVTVGADRLAIQCGECLQVISGGLLVATPHCVRASASPTGVPIGRGAFPVFVDVDPEFPLSAPKGVSREDVFLKTMESRVPPLKDRWLEDGTPFVEFLGSTFKSYYEWTLALQSKEVTSERKKRSTKESGKLDGAGSSKLRKTAAKDEKSS